MREIGQNNAIIRPIRSGSDDGPAVGLSVLMPVYNAGGYLDQAVRSILNQTFSRFKFVIVDDGSTDGSGESLVRWAQHDSRIHLLQSRHVGVTQALKYGLAHINTPYVARMDADDIAVRDRFKQQLAFLQKNPEVVAVGSALTIIDEDGAHIRVSKWHEEHHDIERDLLRGRGGLPHPAAMMRLAVLRRIGDYNASYRYAQDKDLWLRLSEVGRLANLPEPLLMYREHAKNIGSVRRAEQFEGLRRAVSAACLRRGLPLPDDSVLPTPRPENETERRRNWDRAAVRSRQYATAWKHLRSVLRAEPGVARNCITLAAMGLYSCLAVRDLLRMLRPCQQTRRQF